MILPYFLVMYWVKKVFSCVRLGRAGLEALPLRARKFLSFSHPQNAEIPYKSVPHIVSQGSAESPDRETLYKGHS